MNKYKKIHKLKQDFYYLEFGDNNKNVLLCFHGYADTAMTFDVFGKLLQNTHRIIALDLPVTRNREKTQTLNSMADYVHKFVQALKLDKFSLIGFSSGGSISISYADKFPQKVTHVYLLTSTPWYFHRKIFNFSVKYFKKQLLSKQACSSFAFIDTLKPFRRLFKLPRKTKEQLLYIRKHSYSIYSTVINVYSKNLTAKFKKLPSPKTIVQFKDDRILDFKKYYPYFQTLNCKVFVFNKGGHESGSAYWINIASLFTKNKFECTCLIPVYNEGQRFLNTLEKINAVKSISKIVCVDDGSKDKVFDIAIEKYPQIKFIKHKTNYGKTAAVATGLKHVETTHTLLLDADLRNLIADEISYGVKAALNNRFVDMIIYRRKAPFNNASVYSGERIIKTDLLRAALKQKPQPTKFQLEAAINQYCIDNQKNVYWLPLNASNTFEIAKLGLIRGWARDFKTIKEITEYVGWKNYFRQVVRFCRIKFTV